MGLRRVLVALIILATVGFVAGTSLERHQSRHESAATLKSESQAPAVHGEGNGETSAAHAAETGASTESSKTAAAERHPELKPLGVNIEAVPFVVLAAVVSMALGLGAWLRPGWAALLAATAAAMLLFALLDVREVLHQSGEARSGLAVLAGVVAALHAGAALTAGLLALRARSAPGHADAAGTMPT